MSAKIDLDEMKEKVLKTQVRVKAKDAGGSGTIIYSRKNEKGNYSTYCITCHHVIDKAIDVRKEWDSKLKRDRKKEYRQVVTVEFFDWDNVPHGNRPVNYSVDADLVAYDEQHDMALLKLRTIKPAPSVASLCELDRSEQILIGDRVWAVGCALLHDPIVTNGRITHMGDEIDYKDYWMSNAQIIFGNSGGAVFLEDGFQFIGIPSRIDITGWGGSPITHLGYFSPIHRVFQFFDEQVYQFLYLKSHTEEEDDLVRKKVKEKEEERLKKLSPEEEEEIKEEEDNSGP